MVNPGAASLPATQVRPQTKRPPPVLLMCCTRAPSLLARLPLERQTTVSHQPCFMLRTRDPPGASKRERVLPKKKSAKGAKATTSTRVSSRPKHNHSKIATDLFKEWFYANLRHPFPSDEVKAEFADRTGESASEERTEQDAKRADAEMPVGPTRTFRGLSTAVVQVFGALIDFLRTRSCTCART